MAPIDVVQAQSQAATQRQNLATAEGTRRTTELALKRLIVNGTQDPNWNAADRADRPAGFRHRTDRHARRGARGRSRTAPTSQQARKNLQVNDVTLEYLRNQTLPQVDSSARYGLIGQGGTQLRAGGTGVQQSPIGHDSRADTATRSARCSVATTRPGTSASTSATASAPARRSHGRPRARPAESGRGADPADRAADRHRRHQCGDPGRRTTSSASQAAQAAREFAQRQLEAEQSKFEVGMSTNYFVVQAQRDLADGAEQRAAGDPRLPPLAGGAGAAAADLAADLQHHHSRPRTRHLSR